MIIKSLQEFYQLLIPNTPLLAIDLGDKKLGSAISDSNLVMAMPIEVMKFQDDKSKIIYLEKLLVKYMPWGVIIGLPLNMDGSESTQSHKVYKFATDLAKSTSVPIFMQDERLTSSAANSFLKSFGMTRKIRHQVDDQVAACLILESVLESIKNIGY